MEDDATLVERAQRALPGDLRAFETLVARHQSMVLGNCRSLSGSADDAEDLAQEVFVKAYFGLPRIEQRASFGAWLKRIKVNHCLNFLRGKRGRQHVDVDSPETQDEPALQVPPSAHAELLAGEERRRIQAVLDAMPETLGVALLMRDLVGLAYQEIAETLGIGLSATKMRIKRGREEFRRLYDGLPTS